jgi:hypothetical protein
MKDLEFGAAVALGLATLWLATLWFREKSGKWEFVAFGDVPGLNAEAKRVLFLSYARQQRWAFGLLWFSTAVAIMLAVALLTRLILARDLAVSTIREVTSLTIDGCIAGGAGRLYYVASDKVEKALRGLL